MLSTIRHMGTDRNTKAYAVQLGPVYLYFSYNTLIGVFDGRRTYRAANHWGPTTGRHFGDLGIKEGEMIDSQETLTRLASEAVSNAVLRG